MNIAIADIAENGHNVRRTPATAEENEALLASIQAQGILEPVLVRPRTDGAEGFWLVFGHRRLEMARKAGLAEIPAEVREMTDAEALAAQMAENMVRAAMPPIDQWRAMKRLREEGYGLPAAAAALGIAERRAAQLEKLGSMHPDVLAAVEKTGTAPALREAIAIATAPMDMQKRAVKASRHWTGKKEISWYSVAQDCTPKRIPLSRARFDADTVRATIGLVFEEDLFAEPGSEEQFTTTQVDKFLQAQRAAVADDVEKRKAAGERVELVECETSSYSVGLKTPKGWNRTWPEPKKKLTGKKGPCRFIGIVPDGRTVGEVLEIVCDPPVSRTERAKKAAAPNGAAQGTEEAEDTDTPEPQPEDNGITKAGMEMIAKAKTAALRARLRDKALHYDQTLAALILAFCADNVVVRGEEGSETGWRDDRYRHRDLARRIIDAAGNYIFDAPLQDIAAELLARVLDIRSANHQGFGSGAAAEWIGRMIDAEAQLPRFDTAEFLAQVKGAALREVAVANVIKPTGKMSDLRATITGAAEAWRPTAAQFGAPGPKPPAMESHDEGDGEQAEAVE